MGYAVDAPILFPHTPSWDDPVQEVLAWQTDVMRASATGHQQVRQLRDTPRRSFSFRMHAGDRERRVIDAFLRQIGVDPFVLPIFHDAQWLADDLPANAGMIECATAGYDFQPGGLAVIRATQREWELVKIAEVDPAGLTLDGATETSWPAGTRLYPACMARMPKAAKASMLSSAVARLQLDVQVDGPSPCAAAWPGPATYRSLPVLEWRTEESEAGTVQYDRQSVTVDVETAPPYYADLPGMPFRYQSHRFVIHGRPAHAAFRSFMYQLAGRVGRLWVPDWTDAVELLAPVAASGSAWPVAWQGYTLFDYQQVNRRDLRIELYDGSVFYRRVTGSGESGDTEVLQLDASLGRAVAPSNVRQINWMAVCAADADAVQIEHRTDADGISISIINWQALQNDV